MSYEQIPTNNGTGYNAYAFLNERIKNANTQHKKGRKIIQGLPVSSELCDSSSQYEIGSSCIKVRTEGNFKPDKFIKGEWVQWTKEEAL